MIALKKQFLLFLFMATFLFTLILLAFPETSSVASSSKILNTLFQSRFLIFKLLQLLLHLFDLFTLFFTIWVRRVVSLFELLELLLI